MAEVQNPAEEHQALAEFWEKFDLVVYLILIAIVTPPVAEMVGDAWESGGFVKTVVLAFQETVGVSYGEFVLFSLGAYVGFVALLWFDDVKLIQGILLTIASAIGFSVLRSQGLLYPLYPIENAHILAAGFSAAFVLGGGFKLRRSSPPYEFRRVTTVLFWIVTVILAVSFVDQHLVHGTPLIFTSGEGLQADVAAAQFGVASDRMITDAVASSLFLLGAYMFTSYEANNNVVIVGVQRVGKTLLAGSLHIAAEEDGERVRLNPTGPLSSLITSIRTAEEGWGNDEYTGPTSKDEFKRLGFRTRSGHLFKKYVDVDVLDLAGEHFTDSLVDQVEAIVPKSRLSIQWIVYYYESLRGLPKLPEEASGLESEEIQRVLAKQIVHSDTLVVLVDSGSLISHVPYGESDYEAQQDLSEYLDTYVQILRHVDQSVLPEKDVVLVVTKADYLHQLYRRRDTHLSFFTWVNYHLLEDEEGKEKLKPLLNQAQVDRIYPVYYELDYQASMDNGEPVPDRPITVHGNDELLSHITEGC